MADAVFRRRDEYVAARRKRNGIIMKTGASVCALLLVSVVGISVWRALPDIPSVKPTDPTVTASESTQSPTASQQILVSTEQEKTDTKTDIGTVNGQTDNTEESTLPPDPTEPATEVPSTPVDKPQTNVKDPTESTGDSDKPAGEDGLTTPTEEPTADRHPVTNEPTSATDGPADAPPEVDPTEAPVDPTEAPVDPTEAPVDPTEVPTEEATENPTVAEPPMTELYIECNGETVVAEAGDVVTVTVELQADKLLGYMSVLLKYDNYAGYLKIVNDAGLTAYEKNALHVPNIDPDFCYVNYSFNKNGYKGIKVVADGEHADYDFSEKKVFFTFSFEVAKTGCTQVELEIDNIKGADGTVYYSNGNVVTAGNINFDMTVK